MPLIRDPLIIASDGFTLGSKSERFLVRVDGASNEIAAINVGAILIYSLKGGVTLSALRLAERQGLSVVLLDYFNEKVIPLVRSRKRSSVDELMGRFERWRGEEIRRAILSNYKEGMKGLFKLHGLRFDEDPEKALIDHLGIGALRAARQLRLLLWGELCARVTALGLDPHIGLWTSEELGLVKEVALVFQPLIVYAPVISKSLKCGELDSGERRKLALEYDRVMREEYYNPKLSRRVRVRDQLVYECISLVQALRGNPLGYSPFRWW